MVGGYTEDLKTTKLSKLGDGRLPGTIQYLLSESVCLLTILGKCNALRGERERVVWCIGVATCIGSVTVSYA